MWDADRLARSGAPAARRALHASAAVGPARAVPAARWKRAEGGPAEQTFATLVGLSLRPRRLREAAALWEALRAARGADGRDAVWGHPDLLPSADDLSNPDGFVSGASASTLDPIAEIEKLGEAPPDEPGPKSAE